MTKEEEGIITGPLVYLREHESKPRMAWYKCFCGNEFICSPYSIKRGNTKSCGCYRVKRASLLNFKHGITKNGEKPPEFFCWYNMIQRCERVLDKEYGSYGGRGIIVCERWKGYYGFSNFYTDMGTRPTPKHSLDRIDNNGNYEPSNCRWVTNIKQQGNRTNNKWIEFNGVRLIQAQWARELGINNSYLIFLLKKHPFPEVYKMIKNKYK